MKTILFLIQKEFLQIFRNKMMIPIIFAVPVVQLIIIVHAATFELKQVKLHVVDQDESYYSRQMAEKFKASGFFHISGYSTGYFEGETQLQKGKVGAILVLPRHFEKRIIKGEEASFQVVVDAINGNAGALINGYTLSMVQEFNRELMKGKAAYTLEQKPYGIDLSYSFWYNPDLNYKTFMVPGILVILVTIISLLLSSMNIVKEKEIGTIEQINVTPIKKYQFIAGKLLPTLIIALFELGFGLSIGRVFFHIPMEGSLLLLFSVAAVYAVVILGLGLLVSTLTHTQQQAMFVSFFFMIIFILMSGLFTAAENMPAWARQLNLLNPVAYFIRVMRMVLLKGSGFNDIQVEFYSLLALAVLSLSLAVRRYRKTV